MRDLTAKDFAAKKCNNPCRACESRAVGCHSSCQKYNSYLSEYRQVCNDMYLTQKKQNLANDFAYESKLKHKQVLDRNKKRREQ